MCWLRAYRQGARLTALLRFTLKPAVLHLADLVQQPVKRRNACDVAPLSGEELHDLARWQIFELLTVEKCRDRLSLECAEIVVRPYVLVQTAYSCVGISLLAKHGKSIQQ